MHVVLLGDSIFDNKSYVLPEEPDVRAQVEVLLTGRDKVSLLAQDGAVLADVREQANRIPEDATHLVVSAGGNDALQNLHMLGTAVGTLGQALLQVASVQRDFEANYRQLLDELSQRRLPTALCTVYYPRYDEQVTQDAVQMAVNIYDDTIIRLAAGMRCPVIDLRAVCTVNEDYANPIEPSALGGSKIAAAIVNLLQEHDFSQQRTTLFA